VVEKKLIARHVRRRVITLSPGLLLRGPPEGLWSSHLGQWGWMVFDFLASRFSLSLFPFSFLCSPLFVTIPRSQGKGEGKGKGKGKGKVNQSIEK